MAGSADNFLKLLHRGNRIRHFTQNLILILSLLVVLSVSWGLKLTGITMAGEAFCGQSEHTHDEECAAGELPCDIPEHIHIESCYSNINADLETSDDWEASLSGIPSGLSSAESVVAVARSQLGYRESTLNFQADNRGNRYGITRYGQWYGNPYGNWGTMFVSFCLHYAGAADLPANGGAEGMRQEWEQAELYLPADAYSPYPGNVLFFGADGKASFVGIISSVNQGMISVIQGDVGGMVAEITYSAEAPEILGYGLVPEEQGAFISTMAANPSTVIATTVNYSGSMTLSNRCFVLYVNSGNANYAIDGAGNSVPVTVANGRVQIESPNPNALLWTITKENSSIFIQNLSTGRYLHVYNNNNDKGVTTTTRYSSSFRASNSGAQIYSNSSVYAMLDVASGKFVTASRNNGSVFQFAYTPTHTVWLDGTGGGQGQLGGSLNQSYSLPEGSQFTLPQTWRTPDKYGQTLRGWYDVTTQTYYAPGDTMIVTNDTVLYGDWVASTYDIGQYNAMVTDTVSTNSFITTHVFDYNYLFNVQSANPSVTVNANSHTETWRMVTNGKVNHNNANTLGFVFVDYDGSSRLPDMANRNDANNYLGPGLITPGLYTPALAEILFGTDNALDPQTGTGVIGKTYLGTGDHLFQFMSDPNDPHFGYYYYDSRYNAASYNQTDQRFYVYEYLEATSDSLNSDSYSDFLPFNSPYANLNGKAVRNYTYDGVNGEYEGVYHFRYDAKYSDNNNSTNYVSTNYAFGMKMDVDFYLPNTPGAKDGNGDYGNRDLYGKEMHFHFDGDDDVWILVDGELVLDIGGIHGIEGGDINFSTGVVMVNDKVDEKLSAAVKQIKPGEHNLTIMYLERGSSQSNCAFYFNLAPRFSLSIQKEDVLTREVLNGAEFSVYTDAACTVPAELWTSEAAHGTGIPSTNTFRVTEGVANMWGFASGNTYYIKETKPPDADAYGTANGIIRLTIDKDGVATYDVEILNDGSSGVSNGFTVHGIRIDEETQSAYIVATNAPTWVKEVTTVQAFKQWKDEKDHSADYVTVYLTVTDPDGTVRRIREILLSAENDWRYAWTNLPKFAADGKTPIVYGIEEAYVPGYQANVTKVDKVTTSNSYWAEAYALEDKQTYVIKTDKGYLSTTGAGADTGYMWVSEETAKSSDYALWVATVKQDNTVRLKNKAGQIISFYYGNGSPTDFFSSTSEGESNNIKQFFKYTSSTNLGIRVFFDAPNGRDYYISPNMNSSSKFDRTESSGSALVLVPMTKVENTHTETITGHGFLVENIPLQEETALTVNKQWDLSQGGKPEDYIQAQVTVRLLANGVFTGRTVTLNLKNNWTDAFRGLPYKDADGNVITYTVEEVWSKDNWSVHLGPIVSSGGKTPTYSTTITNAYFSGGPKLPSTGSYARLMYILCGGSIMLASLVYGFGSRRKQERRTK